MTDKLLSIPQLGEVLGGMSRSTVYRQIALNPGFPKPVKIGGATRFKESEVQAFICAAAGKPDTA